MDHVLRYLRVTYEKDASSLCTKKKYRHYVRKLTLTGIIKIVPLDPHGVVADDLKSLPALVRHHEGMTGLTGCQM